MDWLDRLSNLNVARTASRGKAPHKPLLLLCVLDMIEDHTLADPWLTYSAALVVRFQGYWSIVYERQQNRPDIRMPFHALGSSRDRVWECFTADDSPSRSRVTTVRCRIDDPLWGMMQDAGFRRMARQRLVLAYFTAPEQVALCSRLGLPEPTTAEVEAMHARTAEYAARRKAGRDSRFRTDVLIGYQFTCALTGYRLTTEDQENMVEAAHIHQLAESRNNAPSNGLALTPDAHWLFDHGLWTAEPTGDAFTVLVARSRFDEDSPFGRSLLAHEGKPLIFAAGATLRPDPSALSWHRRKRFVG